MKILAVKKSGFLKDTRKGTALLVSLLVMGVLISVSIALSSLIMREMGLVRDFVSSGRAYFAAESGVEIALYNLENSLPGWEPTPDDKEGYKYYKLSENSVGEFKVKNRCNAYPCFDDEYEHTGIENLSVYYDYLDLNESISIPLFTVEEDADGVLQEIPVKNFTVEFFALFNPSTDLIFSKQSGGKIDGWDVLRWKIFGIHKKLNLTQAVSDYTAISSVLNTGVGLTSDPDAKYSISDLGNSAKDPSWFGTVSCSESGSGADRYSNRINCIEYAIPKQNEDETVVKTDRAKKAPSVCANTQARQYYDYGDDNRVTSETIFGCYPIENFLADHKLNYLNLTNLINPSVFRQDLTVAQKAAFSRLYFRVEFFDDDVVREFADITANGYSGNSKQSINVKIKRDSYMPVFNFSLYSTYKQNQ